MRTPSTGGNLPGMLSVFSLMEQQRVIWGFLGLVELLLKQMAIWSAPMPGVLEMGQIIKQSFADFIKV